MNDKGKYYCVKDPKTKPYSCRVEDNLIDEITPSINPLIEKSSKEQMKKRRKRISGERIKISKEGIQKIKNQLKSEIPVLCF